MAVILKPCRVPWEVSRSMSGLTLTHTETGISPECSVVFGGGRLGDGGLTDTRRIEISFEGAWFARCGPKLDNDDITSIGYGVTGAYDGASRSYLEWRKMQWRQTGFCPDSGFYVATRSDWQETAHASGWQKLNHYVLDGRDGYVEVLAERFRWREWLWTNGVRDELTSEADIIGSGEETV